MFRSAFTASRLCSQRVSVAKCSQQGAALSSLAGRLRFFADATYVDTSEEDWAHEFKNATVGVTEMGPSTIDYATSAQRMRELLQTGLLRHDDLRVNPERFFLAHRILAEHSSAVGPGFWVRFTVHYNLCAGTVLALGTPEQLEDLDRMQEKGELGCFSLTERLAGVNSGLIVGTVAEWDDETQTFNLNSPHTGAEKNWYVREQTHSWNTCCKYICLHHSRFLCTGSLKDYAPTSQLSSPTCALKTNPTVRSPSSSTFDSKVSPSQSFRRH